MRRLTADPEAVACCGLYCGACGSYLKGSCPGCRENQRASWCKVRSCCSEQGYRSCADCELVPQISDCTKLNNFISTVIGLALNSDRLACLELIRERGYDGYAQHMTFQGRQTLPR